eukprot:XP_762755.1 hypothetical protein [Theileria parva strain Muguga]
MNAVTNVLLFCGAFDPITTGHMIMLDLCIKTNFFSEIRILPSGKREDKQYKAKDEDRTKMCQIAMDLFKKEYPNLKINISDYELKLANYVDTYFTLKHFNDTEPEKSFYFFMGSDLLPQMFDWPHSDNLVNIAHFLIAYREDFEIKQEDLNKLKSYKLLDELLWKNGQKTQTSPASSTQVRDTLKHGHKCGNLLLHPDVMKYVEENKLYDYKKSGVVS